MDGGDELFAAEIGALAVGEFVDPELGHFLSILDGLLFTAAVVGASADTVAVWSSGVVAASIAAADAALAVVDGD